jgi:hypothetical protein
MGGLMQNLQDVYHVNVGGVPVPGQDVWRMPSGQFVAKSPLEIMLSDALSGAANQLISPQIGQDAKAADERNNKLKKALDDLILR